VADIMTSPALAVAAGTPVGAARAMLARGRVRHLPVVDGGLLVGIVSDRDLAGAPDAGAPVAQVMTRTVFVLSPEDSIQHAARLLRDRRFGALPVLDGRSLVGIVSVVDVLGAIA
jgi:acetoin utilization protein AcuB